MILFKKEYYSYSDKITNILLVEIFNFNLDY